MNTRRAVFKWYIWANTPEFDHNLTHSELDFVFDICAVAVGLVGASDQAEVNLGENTSFDTAICLAISAISSLGNATSEQLTCALLRVKSCTFLTPHEMVELWLNSHDAPDEVLRVAITYREWSS